MGITRSREKLYLLNAKVRRIWGNVSYQEPSRFFSEISNDLLKDHAFSYGNKSDGFKVGSSRQFRSVVEGCVGKQMVHPQYGCGTVVASEGAGVDQKVTIRFSGQTERKFLFRYVSGYFSENVSIDSRR